MFYIFITGGNKNKNILLHLETFVAKLLSLL